MQSQPASSASGSYSSGLGRSDPVARADDVTAELLSLNGLQYCSKDTSLSLVTSRCHKRFDAVIPKLNPNATLQYRLDCGSQFLNPRTSFISFTLSTPSATVDSATGSAIFGKDHSALNLFNAYRFNHSSGVEIEHIDDYNTWLNIQTKCSKNKFFNQGIGQLYGLQIADNKWIADSGSGLNGAPYATAGEIIIPLYLISDMFRQNVMLPPWLLAGSLLQLDLAPAWQAFICPDANAANGNYVIDNARIVLDLYTLTDGTVRALSDLSASAGLDLDFTSVWQVNQYTEANSVTVAVQKALSQASAVHTIVRTEEAFSATVGYKIDCFSTVPAVSANPNNLGSGGNYLTLGSLFMPQQPITTNRQLYLLAQQCWNMSNETPNNTLRLADYFETNATTALIPAGGDPSLATQLAFNQWASKALQAGNTAPICFQIFSYLLERSMILASSCAISSQRSLQVIVSLPNTSVPSKRVSVFTEYQKVVSVFLDSCIVRS